MTPKEKIIEIIKNNDRTYILGDHVVELNNTELNSAATDICLFLSELTGKDYESFVNEEEEIK